MKKILTFTLSLLVAGCASMTPEQRATVNDLETQVLNIAVGAANQYVAGGSVNSKQLYADSIGKAAASLTALINSQNAASTPAVQSAIAAKATSPVVKTEVAPQVAIAVQQAIAHGAPANQAVADAAAGLSKAKAQIALAGP